ncbi:MAG: LSM domain-containing protein [Candidatus Ranarchaeia archaeon]
MFTPLEKYIDREISVLMNDKTKLWGVLKGFDRHLNLYITKGKLESDTSVTVYGDLILRGASILAIADVR